MTAVAIRDDLAERVAVRAAAIDWTRIAGELDAQGAAIIDGLLSADECRDLIALYPDDAAFRSKVVMARHGFGRGEYKYFAYPLPPVIGELRAALYPQLAPIANRWAVDMGTDVRFPDNHADFLAPSS
jgi:hypothetical protein